jgi:hypothetical protein
MGEQVADNKERQVVITLEETPDGRFYMPHRILDDKKYLIRGEYHPIGKSLQFPKKWGKKRGVLHFLQHRIDEVQAEIAQSQRYLSKLQALKDEADGWPDELGWRDIPR